MSAAAADSLEAMKVRELTDLAAGMPKVTLDNVDTTRGTANVSIRGLGVAGAIISVDPPLGVCIGGDYLGVNDGIVFDSADLERLQVLRGQQRVLFGRNVVSDAVQINTNKTPERFESTLSTTFELSDEDGNSRHVSGTVSGPISVTFSGRLFVYYTDNEGPIENEFDGSDHGAIEQLRMRPNGIDGSPFNHDPDAFSIAIDELGVLETEAHRFTLQANRGVGANSTITHNFGWRDCEVSNRLDVNAQPVWLLHSDERTEAEQCSNALRCNTLIGNRLNLLTGLFCCKNDVVLHERRLQFGNAVTQDGGGEYDVENSAAFGAVDYDLGEKWALSAGLRYTQEEKEARVASLILTVNTPCRVDQGVCEFDFMDDDDWDSWSPMLGFQETQRAVLRPDQGPTGGATIIKNARVTEYRGVGLDGVFSLTDNLARTGNVGYLDHQYTKVIFDINGDGVVENFDRNLDFPRAPKWTCSVGLLHDLKLGAWARPEPDQRSQVGHRGARHPGYRRHNVRSAHGSPLLLCGADLQFLLRPKPRALVTWT